MLPLAELDALERQVRASFADPGALIADLGAADERVGPTIHVTPRSPLLSRIVAFLDEDGSLRNLDLVSDVPSETPTLADLVALWGPATATPRRLGLPEGRMIIPEPPPESPVIVSIAIDLAGRPDDEAGALLTGVSFGVSRLRSVRRGA